ncbi:MAG: YwqG family protein [Polyangiaceae bacterium]
MATAAKKKPAAKKPAAKKPAARKPAAKKPAAKKPAAKAAAPKKKPAPKKAPPQPIKDPMDRAAILELLRAGGLGQHLALIEPLLRHGIRLSARSLSKKAAESLPLGASRFGGHPDLPPGVAWPTRDDVPMEFVAQIRLKDLAAHDPAGLLPHQGSLLFFYNTQWSVSDSEEDEDKYRCAAVLFHPGDDSELVRTPPSPIQYSDDFRTDAMVPVVHGWAALTFSSQLVLPPGVSDFFESKALARLKDAWQTFWSDYGDLLPPRSDDEYTDNRMLGHISDWDYVEAMLRGEQLLLQVDSDDAADFSWGDCDKLFFVMSEKDLAARDFSRVRLHSGLG